MLSNTTHRIIPALLVAAFCGADALGVKPGAWTHQTEADFAKAEADQALVTNLGEIKLAHAGQATVDLEGDDSIVYDIVRLRDERVFLAVGPEGRLAQYADGQVNTLHTFEGEQIFALAASGNRLWVAVSGANSRVELRAGDDMAVRRTIELPDTRYVWDVVARDGRLYLATGTEGRVVAIDTTANNPEPVVALQTKQENVLCLDIDSEGRLYAGTDGEGLIYRITPQGNGYSTFVLYDAAEPEIGALLVMSDGTVYAGTADAKQARPGRLEKARTEARGRPEQPAAEPKIPNQPPKPSPNPDAAEPATETPTEADKPQPTAENDPVETPAVEPGAEAPVTAEAVRPTPEQYDELREAISQRLDEASESGAITLQASPSSPRSRPSSGPQPASRPSTSRRPGAAPTKAGNAIYQINPEGFVHEVFRESVMILRLARAGQSLLVTTGNEGQVWRVNPQLEEVTILADLDSQQVPSLLNLGEGNVLIGAANPGLLTTLGSGFAKSGSITSEALDAKQISLWGKFQITARTPEGSALQLQTRSGNVTDPEAGSWSDWSDPIDVNIAAGSSDYLEVPSPTARFLQYRLILNSNGTTTPTVQRISLKYLMPNLRPTITSIKTTYTAPRHRPAPSSSSSSSTSSSSAPTDPQPLSSMKVEWQATDPNSDKLTYTLEARLGNGPFVTIAKDLTATNYDWQTNTTPDGRYTLRVIASDGNDNVPSQALTSTRRSDPVIVDNTAPRFDKLAVNSSLDKTNVSGVAIDGLTPLAEIRYNVDSGKDWQ
ncbi:MAG: hypothetical protein ACYTGQ_15600, partial [Planctomycetota bacterium]